MSFVCGTEHVKPPLQTIIGDVNHLPSGHKKKILQMDLQRPLSLTNREAISYIHFIQFFGGIRLKFCEWKHNDAHGFCYS